MSERLTYTVEEAARAIGVSRGLVYELMRRGDLRIVHVGRRVLVPRDAVRDLLGLGQEQVSASHGATPETESDNVTYLVTIRRVRGGEALKASSVLPVSW